MYLQFPCDVSPMGYDCMGRQTQFFSDLLIGHSFHNAYNNLFFSLGERFLSFFFSEEVCTIDSNVSLICSAESYTEMTPSYIFKTEASAKECCKAMHFNERPSRLFLNCIIDDIPANPGSIINISGLRHDNNAGSCCISATSAASILRVDSFSTQSIIPYG